MNFGKPLHKCFLLIFSLTIIFPQIANADPLDNWHWRSRLPDNGVGSGNLQTDLLKRFKDLQVEALNGHPCGQDFGGRRSTSRTESGGFF